MEKPRSICESCVIGLMVECVRLQQHVPGPSHPDFNSFTNALAEWAEEQVDAGPLEVWLKDRNFISQE
jgi:hypothetical protein